jgi:anti-sigma regulatory factor (Ser/Thr protein kinase)
VELPFTGAAPSTARSYLRLFARNLSAATLDEALVMVSELVTNALQHGKPEITLQLWLRPDRIAVAVLDRGDASPSLIHPAPRGDHPHGRGLMLVNALAAHWGVRCSEGRAGKTVWFDLATVD